MSLTTRTVAAEDGFPLAAQTSGDGPPLLLLPGQANSSWPAPRPVAGTRSSAARRCAGSSRTRMTRRGGGRCTACRHGFFEEFEREITPLVVAFLRGEQG